MAELPICDRLVDVISPCSTANSEGLQVSCKVTTGFGRGALIVNCDASCQPHDPIESQWTLSLEPASSSRDSLSLVTYTLAVVVSLAPSPPASPPTVFRLERDPPVS
jgi:hypothetical protein